MENAAARKIAVKHANAVVQSQKQNKAATVIKNR